MNRIYFHWWKNPINLKKGFSELAKYHKRANCQLAKQSIIPLTKLKTCRSWANLALFLLMNSRLSPQLRRRKCELTADLSSSDKWNFSKKVNSFVFIYFVANQMNYDPLHFKKQINIMKAISTMYKNAPKKTYSPEKHSIIIPSSIS